MTRGKGITKTAMLSTNEINTLEGERKEIQETLRALDEKTGTGTRGESIDRPALQKQDARLRDAIEAGTPGKISGMQKDKMYAEAKRLEEEIKGNMPTQAEMEDPRRNPGAVQKHLRWERGNIHNILKWKDLQRQLNPGDPNCSSVEGLRAEGNRTRR